MNAKEPDNNAPELQLYAIPKIKRKISLPIDARSSSTVNPFFADCLPHIIQRRSNQKRELNTTDATATFTNDFPGFGQIPSCTRQRSILEIMGPPLYASNTQVLVTDLPDHLFL